MVASLAACYWKSDKVSDVCQVHKDHFPSPRSGLFGCRKVTCGVEPLLSQSTLFKRPKDEDYSLEGLIYLQGPKTTAAVCI